jgi:hypothetical protein
VARQSQQRKKKVKKIIFFGCRFLRFYWGFLSIFGGALPVSSPRSDPLGILLPLSNNFSKRTFLAA